MKRVPAVLFGALLVLLSAQVVPAGDVNWRVTRTKHFIIYHSDGAESTAGRVGAAAEEWHGRLSRKLKFSPQGITPIYLYPDRRSFSEATGVQPGGRVVGLAHARTLRIRVDASGAYGDIARVIPHEMVHVFLSYRLRGYSARLPLWMHEGLAKYLAGDWSAADAELLADAAAGGEMLSLDQLARVFPTDDRGRSVAYVQSHSVVKYMADIYSAECIPDLLSELEKGESFETALFYSIGVEPDELEGRWRQYLWEEYGPYRWFRFVSAVVSAAMVLFAVLAFRSRVRRKRLKAAEFEEEDTRVIERRPP